MYRKKDIYLFFLTRTVFQTKLVIKRKFFNIHLHTYFKHYNVAENFILFKEFPFYFYGGRGRAARLKFEIYRQNWNFQEIKDRICYKKKILTIFFIYKNQDEKRQDLYFLKIIMHDKKNHPSPHKNQMIAFLK